MKRQRDLKLGWALAVFGVTYMTVLSACVCIDWPTD